MIDPGWVAPRSAWVSGVFRRTYFWRIRSEFPGVQQFRREGDNTMLRLGGPRFSIGYGEVLRVFQTVDIAPSQTYRLPTKRGAMLRCAPGRGILREWLIYPGACVADGARREPGHRRLVARREELIPACSATSYWFGHRPVHLSLSVFSAGTFVDIDNIALIDSAGRNLIRNESSAPGRSLVFLQRPPSSAVARQEHVSPCYFEPGSLRLVLFAVLYLYSLLELRAARDTATRSHGLLGALAGPRSWACSTACSIFRA